MAQKQCHIVIRMAAVVAVCAASSASQGQVRSVPHAVGTPSVSGPRFSPTPLPSGPSFSPSAAPSLAPSPGLGSNLGSAPSVGGSGGIGAGGGAPPATSSDAYVVAVCAFTTDITDTCLERSATEASEKLAEYYLKQYAKQVVTNSLKLRFPNAISATEQFRFIARMEDRAIRLVAAQLRADVKRLEPYQWDSEYVRQQKWAAVHDSNRQVDRWESQARSDAGSNWSREERSNTHAFREGNAYRQLRSINLRGWGGT